MGLVLLDVAATWYTSEAWSENKGSYLFVVLGVFLILTGVMVRSVKKARLNPKKYIKDVLWKQGMEIPV